MFSPGEIARGGVSRCNHGRVVLPRPPAAVVGAGQVRYNCLNFKTIACLQRSSASPFAAGSSQLKQSTSSVRRIQRPFLVSARAPAADAVGNRGLPSFLVRVASAICYIIPWLSIESMGQEIYRRIPHTVIFYLIPGPFINIYYSSQFAPLIIFFLLYLSVVKNNKLHHFVRFNCMQAIQLDISAMLFHLLRTYFPAEFRWSWVLDVWDMASWSICMCTILYCVIFALWGKYADIPYVSESVYLQVDSSM
eukprot:jgi/Botrbrau1/7902/Bobra.9_2s0075.1